MMSVFDAVLDGEISRYGVNEGYFDPPLWSVGKKPPLEVQSPRPSPRE